jgi:hypothetical protein
MRDGYVRSGDADSRDGVASGNRPFGVEREFDAAGTVVVPCFRA